MIGQTILPREWIIVDDGSTDRTRAIASEAAVRHSWIRVIARADRGFRKPGAGIIEAFYAGFDALICSNWQFMAKLDGDLSFAPDYFEKLFGNFEQDPRLGIAGGTLYHVQNGSKVIERCPTFHVRGGAKVFRRECWDAIGGLWVGYGSDTVDEVKANMLGWTSRSFAELEMHHHRPTGATYGKWGSLIKDGRADYVVGYHPLFLFAKCAARLFRYPYVLGSCALLYGYLGSAWKGIGQVDDPKMIRYLRSQQLARLCGRETIWR